MSRTVLLAAAYLVLFAAAPALAEDCVRAGQLVNEAAGLFATQPDVAERAIAEAAELCPQSASIRYNLARVQYRRGRYETAEANLERALELRPDYSRALNDLAYLQLTKPGGDSKRAIELARQALELEPGNADFRDTLTRAEGQYYPADLTMALDWSDDNGNQILEAGESGTLTVTLANGGRGTARDVRLTVSPEREVTGLLFSGDSKTVKALHPGADATFAFPVRTEELRLPTGTLGMRVTTDEARGFYADPQLLTVATRALVPPNLQVVDVGVADQNENGQIEPREIVEVTARIQNRGAGAARGVVARVELGSDVYATPDTQLVHELGPLGPGEYRDVPFTVYTSKRATAIDVALGVQEERERFNDRLPLELAFNRPQKRSLTEIDLAAAAAAAGPAFVAPDVAGLSVDTDLPPATGTLRPDAVAVVIGNKNYEDRTLAPVEFAQRDAQVIREYLVKTLGFRERNIFLELDADKADFEKLFGDASDHRGLLYDRVKPGASDVFVFYSGHGAPDTNTGKAFLVPSNADPIALKLTAYPLETLSANLARLNQAKRPRSLVLLLDSCFSGGYDGGMVIAEASPLFVEYENPLARIGMDNAVVLASSQGNQISSWYRAKRHGLFTYLVLKTIKEAAAAGRELTVGDLEQVLAGPDGVSDHAWRLHRRNQEPLVVGNRDLKLVTF